jgi:hypothetical protein
LSLIQFPLCIYNGCILRKRKKEDFSGVWAACVGGAVSELHMFVFDDVTLVLDPTNMFSSQQDLAAHYDCRNWALLYSVLHKNMQ